MTAHTKMSAKGQVVIPKDVRDRLGFGPGVELEVIESGGGVWLKPRHHKSGRTFDEITADIRARLPKWEGPPVTIKEMNESIDQCWREAALRSDM